MAFSVEGKIALITGAATGMGFQYACELLRQGLKGVTIVDLDEKNGEDAAKQLNKEYGRKVAIFVRADLTKSEEIKNAFTSSVDEWKSLEIVINNAGMMRDRTWEKEIQLNCNAVVNSCLFALEHMGKNRGGKGGVVVNVSSALGLQAFCQYPVYVGTKHFIVGMTRSFGEPYFYNLTGIKFLTLCPGLTDTPLISESTRYTLENFGLESLMIEHVTTSQYQTAEHVAKGLFTMITQGENGSVWVCEGGQPIYEVILPDRQTLKKKCIIH